MSRIQETLSRFSRQPRRGFIPFITAGDPDLESSLNLAVALGESCADVLEIGVPFSDPVADGPVIQRSSMRALDGGVTLSLILDLVARIREKSPVPVVLFSYFNPLLQYGLDRLAVGARQAGVDGLLVTDLTPEESKAYLYPFRKEGVDTVFLVSPTTTADRMKHITGVSRGFIYLISRAGVTGTQDKLADDLQKQVERIRDVSYLPVAVGFGVSRPEHVGRIWEFAEAAVVGSALVQKVEELGGSAGWIDRTVRFARWLKGDLESLD